MLFSLLLSCVALFRNSFNEISLSEFNLVSQPLRYYTKYLIEMQHFYSDCYITDCGITHAAAAPPSVALCQNRQASTNSYIMRTSRCGPGRPGKLLSEQTSKQLSTGYSQFMAKLSTALPHELSSVAQEPWSPVHMGSVFSPWTTNDSTWDA